MDTQVQRPPSPTSSTQLTHSGPEQLGSGGRWCLPGGQSPGTTFRSRSTAWSMRPLLPNSDGHPDIITKVSNVAVAGRRSSMASPNLPGRRVPSASHVALLREAPPLRFRRRGASWVPLAASAGAGSGGPPFSQRARSAASSAPTSLAFTQRGGPREIGAARPHGAPVVRSRRATAADGAR